jgi:hypothetical protein
MISDSVGQPKRLMDYRVNGSVIALLRLVLTISLGLAESV